MFTVDGFNLLYNGKIIFKAPAELEIVDAFDDKALLFYETYKILDMPQTREDINRNILMVCKSGKILWRIDNPEMDKDNTYASLYKKENKWKAYLYKGYDFDLNLETGAISNCRFVR